MKREERKLILASASPRRKALLEMAGLTFDCIPADVDENIAQDMTPEDAVQMLAERKAEAVVGSFPESIVIGADTVVAMNGKIYGKPLNEDDAFCILKELSGKTHRVYTGIAIKGPDIDSVFFCCTAVTFFPLSGEEIRAYIQTGEPMDKAGAYGIQGIGRFLVESISGNYENVIGLPVGLLTRKLREIVNFDFSEI